MSHRLYRLIEFVVLFFGVPTGIILLNLQGGPLLILWVFAAGCLAVLLLDRSFDRRQLWNTRAWAQEWWRVLLRFVVLGGIAAILVAAVPADYFPSAGSPPKNFLPEMKFGFVRENPLFWGIVMVCYPIISVYPQGIVYRAFVFHRYGMVFNRPWAIILMSAIVFAFVHIIFQNWVAPAITFIGGLLFAWTFHRTRSQFVASVEHALYGCLIITIGIGWYVYHGSIETVKEASENIQQRGEALITPRARE